jgi:hypothetical protein
LQTQVRTGSLNMREPSMANVAKSNLAEFHQG